MKKLVWLLVIVMLLGNVQIVMADEGTAVAAYTAVFSTKQGENGWYFMKFGSKITELEWDYENRWGRSPYVCSWEMNTGADGSGVGYKFVAPIRGTVRLRGKVEQTNPECKSGDGVAASIYKGETKLWENSLIKYGIASGEYDVTTSVRKGDILYFRVDPRANNYFDWTVWFPTVEYTDGAFSGSEENTYFQKKDGILTELKYNEEKDGYIADDGLAFINGYNVMPTDEYSLVRRYEVKEDGRYRVKADIYTEDIRGSGLIVKVYKNGDEIWKQMFVDDKGGIMDIRLYALKEDVIEVEVCANGFGGYNFCEWTLNISKYLGTLPCVSTTVEGRSSGVVSEMSMGSLVSEAQNAGSIEYYSIKNDEIFPMVYDGASGRWNQDLSSSRYTESWLVYMNQKGYISKSFIAPGQHTQSVLEKAVTKDGILNIAGDFGVKGTSDGVVIDIYHNDRLLWSSRVGGARSVRWDEPYDVSYFQYNTDVVARVSKGDKMKFVFDMWRRAADDDVDISGISLKYLKGDILSDTTKWKMDNSIIIDTAEKCAYVDGKYTDLDLFIQNGTTYISGEAARTLLGFTGNDEYIPVRNAAGEKNVLWAANRLVIIYDGIPVMYGFSELSEIETALKEGVLFE